VAERRRNAGKEMDKLRKKGVDIQPISIEGTKIAKSFWGKGWCDHLESFSDYSNRLPRGRTYVRNGSVCHLAISPGLVEAFVSGSELYKVKITISELATPKWNALKKQCQGQIGSLLELLQGKLSESILKVVTDRKQGLFPQPGEIKLACSCPDWATMCKHVAAVLYGVGSRLDHQPELLFLLRGVDHEELIVADAESAIDSTLQTAGGKQLDSHELADIFGIDLAQAAEDPSKAAPKKSKKSTRGKAKGPSSAAKSAPAKKSARKKSAKKTTAKASAKKKRAAKKKKET
jgi:uncharacterized Zn finger protein